MSRPVGRRSTFPAPFERGLATSSGVTRGRDMKTSLNNTLTARVLEIMQPFGDGVSP
jgi:hypothetical protein